MLFRKKMPRSCTYCLHSTVLNDAQVLCTKRGVVDCERNCRKFQYDPCKRIPPKQKALDTNKYSDEDFTL